METWKIFTERTRKHMSRDHLRQKIFLADLARVTQKNDSNRF